MKYLMQFLIFTGLVACALYTLTTFEVNPPTFIFTLIGFTSYLISYAIIELWGENSIRYITHVEYNVIDGDNIISPSYGMRVYSRKKLTLSELKNYIIKNSTASNVKITRLTTVRVK